MSSFIEMLKAKRLQKMGKKVIKPEFETMTVKELRAYADIMNITLKAIKKADIIKELS